MTKENKHEEKKIDTNTQKAINGANNHEYKKQARKQGLHVSVNKINEYIIYEQ